MDKFKNKYRIQSNRKPNWDYSANGHYYLTIITQHRVCILGDIINNEMILSDFGKIVEIEWYKSFEIRDELILHEYILMPNHLHAIVEIYNDKMKLRNKSNIVPIIPSVPSVPSVEMNGRSSLRTERENEIDDFNIHIKRNPATRLPKSISSFIAGFKSAVNTKIDNYIDDQNLSIPKYNRSNHFFQPNYYDHIIRNNEEYQNIKYYILNNPKKWDNDSLNK